jgi:phosphoribosylglycinamide formyltransferase-1
MKSGSGNYLRSMKKMAVFASGAGTNAQKIIDHFSDKNKKAIIALIVCNNPSAGVLQIASKQNIPALIIEKKRFFRGDAYLPELKNAQIDLIVLAGFLWKIPQALVDAYRGRIINIHPALLPKHGGKGMYGAFVHEAVLDAGDVESGITIHYVDEHYDQGDIIFQTKCPVDKTDNIESLSKKIHQLEHQYYPIVIEEVLNKIDPNSVQGKRGS